MNIKLAFLLLFGIVYSKPTYRDLHSTDGSQANVKERDTSVVEPDTTLEDSKPEAEQLLDSLDGEVPTRKFSGKNSKRVVFSLGRIYQMAHQNAHHRAGPFHIPNFQYFLNKFKGFPHGR